MNKRIAANVSLMALMIVLSRAEEAQAQKIKDRLSNKSAVDRRKERATAATTTAGAVSNVERRIRHQPARMRERARVCEPMIAAAARRHGVDPRALWTIAYLETRFRPELVSPKGARGMMQFMPETARAYGLKNPHRPADAIDAAARHVRDLSARYENCLDLVLAGYNAGETAVDAYLEGRSVTLRNGKVINRREIKTGGIPPYRVTRKYVSRGLLVFNRVAKAGIFGPQLLAGLKPLNPLPGAGANLQPKLITAQRQSNVSAGNDKLASARAPHNKTTRLPSSQLAQHQIASTSRPEHLTANAETVAGSRPRTVSAARQAENSGAVAVAAATPVSVSAAPSLASATRRRIVDLPATAGDVFVDMHSGERFLVKEVDEPAVGADPRSEHLQTKTVRETSEPVRAVQENEEGKSSLSRSRTRSALVNSFNEK